MIPNGIDEFRFFSHLNFKVEFFLVENKSDVDRHGKQQTHSLSVFYSILCIFNCCDRKKLLFYGFNYDKRNEAQCSEILNF